MNVQTGKQVRVYPPVYLLLAVFVMVGLHLALPFRHVIPSGLRYLGIALLIAGLVLDVWAAGLFARAGTSVKPLQPSSALVTGGPYRLSRNPMYLGMVISLLGLGLWLGALTPFVIVPAFALFIEHRFIRREEAMMEATFGAAYAEYKNAVRRWI